MASQEVAAAQEIQKRTAKINDINAKLKIAKRIVQACEEESTGRRIELDNINERIYFYTKAEPYLIYKIKSYLRPEKRYWSWLLDQDLDSKVKFRRYEDVREEIIDSYINKREIPTKISLSKGLRKGLSINKDLKDDYSDIVVCLKNAGFTWIRLPGTDKSIIIEKPEQASKRHRYLQQIMKNREDGRCFVYVEERNFTRHGMVHEFYALNKNEQYFFMAVTTSGLSDLFFQKNTNDDNLEKCLLEAVIPYIPQSCVIVLSEKTNHKKIRVVPHQNSPKSEMSEWLTRNNIPHEPKAHRAELFALIQKCKSKVEKESYKLDELLKVHGHDVLYRPYGMTMLNFFSTFLNDIKKYFTTEETHVKQFTTKSALTRAKSTYTNEQWTKCEDKLIAMEKKVYEEDMQMEVIVDQLMTMAKYGGIAEADLPSGLDSDLPDDQLLFNVIAF